LSEPVISHRNEDRSIKQEPVFFHPTIKKRKILNLEYVSYCCEAIRRKNFCENDIKLIPSPDDLLQFRMSEGISAVMWSTELARRHHSGVDICIKVIDRFLEAPFAFEAREPV